MVAQGLKLSGRTRRWQVSFSFFASKSSPLEAGLIFFVTFQYRSAAPPVSRSHVPHGNAGMVAVHVASMGKAPMQRMGARIIGGIAEELF